MKERKDGSGPRESAAIAADRKEGVVKASSGSCLKESSGKPVSRDPVRSSGGGGGKEGVKVFSKDQVRSSGGGGGKEGVKVVSKDPVRSSGGKEVVKVSSKDPVRSSGGGKEPVKAVKQEQVRSIGKDLLKVSKELGSSHGREQQVKAVKKELGNDQVRSTDNKPVKVIDKEKQPVRSIGKDILKASKESVTSHGREQQGKVVKKDLGKVNGKEQGNSNGKVVGKSNGKDSGGARALVKVKDERDRVKEERQEEKGNSPVVKTTKPGSVTKVTPKTSSQGGASSSLGQQSIKKKLSTITTTTTTKTTSKRTVKDEKKEKKVYTLPGQKHDPPEERDALRIFYSTLREQLPESEMAEIWLMEHGLLPHDEAKKALEHRQKRVHNLKHGTPMKSSTPSRVSNGSTALKKSVSNGKGKDVSTSKGKKKREDSESDSDDDFLQRPVKKKLKS